MSKSLSAGEKFELLVEIMDTLRGDQGCPWDREQDENSIVNYFLEEVYEAVDAVASGDVQSLKEELGDVLMEVVFLSRIFQERADFTVTDVLDGINQKMIRRHPHVFGRKQVHSSAKVLDVWNKQKKTEKERVSILDGIAEILPALLKAFQIGQRVSAYGFDWDQPSGALQKVREELDELEQAIQSKKGINLSDEMGDCLFSLVNVSRQLHVNPEIALRQTNDKFIKRFRYIEDKLREKDRDLEKVSLEEMEALWEESKGKVDSPQK